MVGKDLLIELFQAAEMRRWNDKLCPVPLTELDKQGHKMTIAYVLGKFAEHEDGFSWTEVIEGGLFEYFERLTLTDIKPQVFERIKANEETFTELKKEVYARFTPIIADLDGLDERFEAYLFHPQDSINRKILDAAHYYATKWEFDIIKHENWNDYEIDEIQRGLQRRQEALSDVDGLQKLALFPTYRSFVDLCGRLRFQVRWGQLYRIPRTSVLGHMLIVAILSYLFSLTIDACSKRRTNNYFAGLFHDLPEVLTKDVISPVKRASTGVDRFVKEFEREEMQRRIYRPKLIPQAWEPEMRMFTEDEFASKVTVEGKLQNTTSDAITATYNHDQYNAVDGELVKAADDLAAFMEAYLALQNGISNAQLRTAVREKSLFYRHKTIAGIDFGKVYKGFN
ncbi:MAG: HD domain-containing protein [Euryarchaeota archaeon]|nr:HD domain-containing protein [Euryarchaeota archaeon]